MESLPTAPFAPSPANLIEQHIGLVDDAVAYYRRRMVPWADFAAIRSGAHLGLIHAAETYDATLTPEFHTYARAMIRRGVQGELRRLSPEPRTIRALRLRVTVATDELTRLLGRPPSASELAARLDMTPAEYARAAKRLSTALSFVSLDALQEINPALGGVTCDETERRDAEALHAILRECVDRLPYRFRRVLQHSYFEGHNITDLTGKFRLTKSRLSQIHQQALHNVRCLYIAECRRRGVQREELPSVNTTAPHIPAKRRVMVAQSPSAWLCSLRVNLPKGAYLRPVPPKPTPAKRRVKPKARKPAPKSPAAKVRMPSNHWLRSRLAAGFSPGEWEELRTLWPALPDTPDMIAA